MSLVAALGRIDDIQQRIRSLSPEQTGDAAVETADGAAGTGRTTAGAFADAVRDVESAQQLASNGVTGEDIVAQATSYLGVPYVFAGEDRSGMDCSGLVQRVLADLGIDAPRVVQDQALIGEEVPSLAEARPGDLIVEKGQGHILIYAGDGKVIHAPSPGKFVELRNNYLTDAGIHTIRRVAPAETAAVAPASTASLFGAASPAVAAATAPTTTTSAAARTIAAPTAVTDRVSRIVEGLSALSAPVGRLAASGATDASVSSTVASTFAAALSTASPARATTAAATPTAGVAESIAGATAMAAGPADGADTVAAPIAPAAASAPARTPFATQVTAPVLSMARAGDGDHTMTLRVSPENLGPVTVTAHISGSTVTIELASGSSAGRDALRAMIGDLRRELAGLSPLASVAVAAGDPAGGADAQSSGSSGAPFGGAGSFADSGSGRSSHGQPAFERTSPQTTADDRSAALPAPPVAPVAVPAAGIDLFA